MTTSIASSPTTETIGLEPVQICPPIGQSVLIYNTDLTNVAYVGYSSGLTIYNSTQVQPLTYAVIDASKQVYAFCPTAQITLNVTPGGTYQSPSPAQTAAQIQALGLMKDTTGQAIHTTLGIPAQTNDVISSLPTNLQSMGVPPFVPGIKSAAAVQMSPGTSPQTLVTFSQDGELWYASLSFSVSTDSTFASTDGPFAYLYLQSTGEILLACQLAINGPGQSETANQNLSFGGIVVSSGDSILVNINNGTSVADAFIRAGAVVLYTLGFSGGGGGGGNFGKLVFLAPSGDVTGITDANAIMTCYNNGEIPFLTPGAYYWEAGIINITTPGFYIWGSGEWATIVNGVGSGTLLRMYWTEEYIPHSQNLAGGGIKGGLTFDLNSMTAPSYAIHAGDIYNLEWECGVRYAPGPIAVWFDNNYHWTEQMRGRIWVENNVGINVAFDNSANLSGAATGSFDRLDMDVYVNQNGLGHGVVFQNGANVIDGPGLKINGNFTGGASLWYVLKLIGSNTQGYSLLTDCGLNIGVELDTLTGTVPGTIDFDSQQNNVIEDCTGIIDFGAGDQFAGAHNAQGSFKFDGPVYGDGFLQSAGPLYGNAFKSLGTGGGGNLASGNSITTRFAGVNVVLTNANVTGIILQGFPPDDWRILWILNNGTGTITFDVPATSHVATGTACVIQPNSVQGFIWDEDQLLWYPIQ